MKYYPLSVDEIWTDSNDNYWYIYQSIPAYDCQTIYKGKCIKGIDKVGYIRTFCESGEWYSKGSSYRDTLINKVEQTT